MKKIVIRALLALVLLGGLFYAYTGYLIHQHRDVVKAKLNDPDSAKFRNERLVGPLTLKGGLLCGEVNAKNAMGGYVGYRKFAASAGQNDVELAPSETEDTFVKAYCE